MTALSLFLSGLIASVLALIPLLLIGRGANTRGGASIAASCHVPDARGAGCG